jgi:Ca2+-binding RTX toxin-like protein
MIIVTVKRLASLSLAAVLIGMALSPTATARRCTIVGTTGNDDLTGTRHRDVICGRGGIDHIVGRGGEDVLRGGAGDDDIEGGAGADRMHGGRGDDRISAGPGGDVLRGGPLHDTLYDGVGHDRISGGKGRDYLLIYLGGRDVAHGGPGSDGCLWSTDGHPGDRVVGGSGTDVYRSDRGDGLRGVEARRHCADIGIPSSAHSG